MWRVGHNTQFAGPRAAGRFSAPHGETLLPFPPRSENITERARGQEGRQGVGGWVRTSCKDVFICVSAGVVSGQNWSTGEYLCGGDTYVLAEELEPLWFTALLLRVPEAFECYISLHSVRSACGSPRWAHRNPLVVVFNRGRGGVGMRFLSLCPLAVRTRMQCILSLTVRQLAMPALVHRAHFAPGTWRSLHTIAWGLRS